MLEFLFLLEHVGPDVKPWIVQFSDNIWECGYFWSPFITVVLAILLLICLIIIFIRIWDRRVIPWAIKYVLPWLEKIKEDFSTGDSSSNPDSVDDVRLSNNNLKTKIEKLERENSELKQENKRLEKLNEDLKQENKRLEELNEDLKKKDEPHYSAYSYPGENNTPKDPEQANAITCYFKTNDERKFPKAYNDDEDKTAIFKAHITGDRGWYELVDNGPIGISRIRGRDGNQYVIFYKLKNCLLGDAKKFTMIHSGTIVKDGDSDSWSVQDRLEGTFE